MYDSWPGRELYLRDDKVRYLCEVVLQRMWNHRERIARLFNLGSELTLNRAWQELLNGPYVGWDAYQAWQWVAGLRETRYLGQACDKDTFAAIGPGSGAGLNLLLERKIDGRRPFDSRLAQQRGRFEMSQIQKALPPILAPHIPCDAVVEGVKTISLADLESCLSGFAKHHAIGRGQSPGWNDRYVPRGVE